ncbi:hypothetical protein IscW_ISCW009858 [Ixodes scapularis]|uniref:Uncharacterized protein n=1 Tax=Ixodes scapularis TaxID=6945 RepID=B7Q3Q3_IXOSC|nr:hypothetical protein IscW_ISCW009858 [Ixodes scapularis]|eukprot:XP_002411351.1 hypothetical protein IscW_ISCW009858 [Ixodes scapularis]
MKHLELTRDFNDLPQAMNRVYIYNSTIGYIDENWLSLLKNLKRVTDSGAEVNPSGAQTRDSPHTSTKSSCRCPTAISDRGGGHNFSTVTTSALQEDAGPGTRKPKHLSRRAYAHDTPLAQDFHAAGRIATNR